MAKKTTRTAAAKKTAKGRRRAARVTLTIPAGLRDRMAAYEADHPDVNWSAVAAAAFAQHLDDAAPAPGETPAQRSLRDFVRLARRVAAVARAAGET